MRGGAESSRDYFSVAKDITTGFMNVLLGITGKRPVVTRCCISVTGVAAAGVITLQDSIGNPIFTVPADVTGVHNMPALINGIAASALGDTLDTQTVGVGVGGFIVVEGYYTLG